MKFCRDVGLNQEDKETIIRNKGNEGGKKDGQEMHEDIRQTTLESDGQFSRNSDQV